MCGTRTVKIQSANKNIYILTAVVYQLEKIRERTVSFFPPDDVYLVSVGRRQQLQMEVRSTLFHALTTPSTFNEEVLLRLVHVCGTVFHQSTRTNGIGPQLRTVQTLAGSIFNQTVVSTA